MLRCGRDWSSGTVRSRRRGAAKQPARRTPDQSATQTLTRAAPRTRRHCTRRLLCTNHQHKTDHLHPRELAWDPRSASVGVRLTRSVFAAQTAASWCRTTDCCRPCVTPATQESVLLATLPKYEHDGSSRLGTGAVPVFRRPEPAAAQTDSRHFRGSTG